MKNITAMHFSLLNPDDIDLLRKGKHYQLHEKLGSHILTLQGVKGTFFAVWAPNASRVSVIGNFNNWSREEHVMNVRWDGSGIWELFIPEIEKGEVYKYYIESPSGFKGEKGDPYAYRWEMPPNTASIVWDLDFTWSDEKWLGERSKKRSVDGPISIYEVHLGSWKRAGDEGRFLTYLELAETLPQYCQEMGFTHVELMPVMEHPFYGSWGYQLSGYFAPSSRFGSPQDLMHLINAFHELNIGVILDWVPSHFPTDAHGLGYFDGDHLYEHADPRLGFHPDWKSFVFNYGRHEVRSFLISNALFWLEKYHIDGLRVDGVASILYLDYSRKDGEWIPNIHGGRENLDAVSLLQDFNQAVHEHHPDVFTIAEESTAWPGVTATVENGGLGFDLKWMMGWMHDTLDYFESDPVYRSYMQGQLTFSIYYAFTEKFALPLSHDEVVYGKKSLINKMPGDTWQQFANLRLLYTYMYGHPGAKLLFMGAEFAQRHEWRHDYSLDWHELEDSNHLGIQTLIKDLNQLYTAEPALYELNFSPDGFEWIDHSDSVNSVLCWLRKGKDRENDLLFIGNFTPVTRQNYRVGVPTLGFYTEIFNTDNLKYGGSDGLNRAELETAPIPKHGKTHSLSLTLPPLGITVLKYAHADEALKIIYNL